MVASSVWCKNVVKQRCLQKRQQQWRLESSSGGKRKRQSISAVWETYYIAHGTAQVALAFAYNLKRKHNLSDFHTNKSTVGTEKFLGWSYDTKNVFAVTPLDGNARKSVTLLHLLKSCFEKLFNIFLQKHSADMIRRNLYCQGCCCDVVKNYVCFHLAGCSAVEKAFRVYFVG